MCYVFHHMCTNMNIRLYLLFMYLLYILIIYLIIILYNHEKHTLNHTFNQSCWSISLVCVFRLGCPEILTDLASSSTSSAARRRSWQKTWAGSQLRLMRSGDYRVESRERCEKIWKDAVYNPEFIHYVYYKYYICMYIYIFIYIYFFIYIYI